MSSTTIKMPKSRVTAFKVLTIIARILFFPALIITVLILGTFSATAGVNNVADGKKQAGGVEVSAGWGYYVAKPSDGSGTISYAKKVSDAQILGSKQVLYYDILAENGNEKDYRIAISTIASSNIKDGKIFYNLSDAEKEVPHGNIIGEVVESIPVVYKLVLTNFNTITDLLTVGVLPLVLILIVFVIDSVIYVRTKNIKIARGINTTRKEQENLKYFEEIKRTYASQQQPQQPQQPQGAVPTGKPPRPPKGQPSVAQKPSKPAAPRPKPPAPLPPRQVPPPPPPHGELPPKKG